ncbi:molecular chaperone TorD [Candidatus Fermentibacteria bacterium]|nr:MAG: molecular chaperone TorD [Candidatus Fermentibacteria bacterium]
MSNTAEANFIPEEDLLRADLYDYLAALLSRPPTGELLGKTAELSGDDSELGQAIYALSRLAKATKTSSAEREFNALFIGMARGELLPYASFYLTGFLNEKPLATLRRDMLGLAIERAANVFEPEDNIASLCEMMAGMIRGRFGSPADVSIQRDFFNKHIGPWASHFFKDLEGAKNSVLYAPVGTVGRVFMGIEREGFRMASESST